MTRESVFSMTKGRDKVEVLKGDRGTFDVLYYFDGDTTPVEVGVPSLPMAMELARDFIDESSEQ